MHPAIHENCTVLEASSAHVVRALGPDYPDAA
jgi:hypothetical protein